jgi:hypothetical protein
MNDRAALKRKLQALNRRVVLARALMKFLQKHPAVASRTLMWNLKHKPGLYFFEKAFIRPVWTKNRVALRLERYVDPSSNLIEWGSPEVVCSDVSRLSRKELDKALRKVKVDLDNTELEDEQESA